jgi:hypothetical protein
MELCLSLDCLLAQKNKSRGGFLRCLFETINEANELYLCGKIFNLNMKEHIAMTEINTIRSLVDQLAADFLINFVKVAFIRSDIEQSLHKRVVDRL